MDQKWVDVLAENQLANGEGIELVLDGKLIALYHVDGEWLAIDGTCPHHGGPLGQGTVCDGQVICPWHGLQVNLRSGEYVLGESRRLATYPARCRSGRVELSIAPIDS